MRDDSQIKESPDHLDGARVIKWAWSGHKPFGLLPIADSDSDSVEIYGVAICQYDGATNVYMFSCDRDWEVQHDGLYDSVDDAIRLLPDQYKMVTIKWQTK